MRMRRCPKCHAPAVAEAGKTRMSIRCSECDIKPSVGKGRAEAVAAWNSRKDKPFTNAEKARRIRKVLLAMPDDHPNRAMTLKSWRWHEARSAMKPKPRKDARAAAPKSPRKARHQDVGGSLRSKIDAYDTHIRSMTHMLAGQPDWNKARLEANRLEAILLAHECRSPAQVVRLATYIRSAGIKVTAEFMAGKREQARAASRATDRSFDNPQTTYEIGIIGSDRVPLASGEAGFGRYHKTYPLDIMDVGESFLAPGIKRRAQIGAALDTASYEHKRRFKTEATADGLLVTRTE